ncbi:hypothetical protein NM688_g411 [Phlebia brevispora]|uniref:Uncharacterized protein n=1 Tax=Phlebia brevispora TaxID=194682 RepID=A0ACC1TEF0_9APHY|nr:hypothetical protein NM688_g411 [Phlebia brevispora]
MFTNQALILFCIFMFYLTQHYDDINLIIMHIEHAYHDTHPPLPAHNNDNDNVDAGAWGNVPDVNSEWGDIDDDDVQQGWGTVNATAAPSVVSD